MRTKLRVVSLILLLLYPSIYATAERVKSLSTNLRGEVHYSWLFFDVYHARLWAESSIAIYTKPFTLELIYKRALKGNDITDRSLSELLEQGVEKETLKKWESRLRAIFPDVRAGDRIFANFMPDEGVNFYLNEQLKLGEIKDIGFSVVFMNIWLGEKTSEWEMRKQLLGDKK